jgi:hypothetical protein
VLTDIGPAPWSVVWIDPLAGKGRGDGSQALEEGLCRPAGPQMSEASPVALPNGQPRAGGPWRALAPVPWLKSKPPSPSNRLLRRVGPPC